MIFAILMVIVAVTADDDLKESLLRMPRQSSGKFTIGKNFNWRNQKYLSIEIIDYT